MTNFLSTLLGPGEALGLSVGQRAVQAARVSRSGTGFKLVNSSSVEFPAGRSPHPSEVEDALRKTVDLIAGERTRLVVNVPSRLSRLYLFDLPFDQPEKIRQVLSYSLEPFLMSRAEDLIFDYLPLAENRKGKPGIAFGAEPAAVSSALEDLRSSGLEPDVILPDSLGLIVAGQFLLREKSEIEPRLLLDLGATQTSMVLYDTGRIISVRTIHYGGRNLTRGLAESLNVDMSEAETVKYQTNLSSEESSQAGEVLTEAWQPILREIRRTLAASLTGTDNSGPALVLAGGGALTPGLPEFLNRVLGLRTELLSSEGSDESRLSGLTPDMVPAAGLAMASLAPERPNLRQGEMAPKQALTRYRRSLGLMAGGVFLAGVIGFGNLIVDYRYQNRRYEATRAEILEIFKEASPEVTRIVSPLAQLRQKVEETRASLTGRATAQTKALDLLLEISRVTKKRRGLRLLDLSMSPLTIELQGEGESFEDVDRLKDDLVGLPFFSEVAVGGARMDPTTRKLNFKISLKRKIE